MKSKPSPSATEDTREAFTLVETLVALTVMAIVIPVTLEGMSSVNRAAILGQRKETAARVAERVLNEYLIASTQSAGSQEGSLTEGGVSYRWSIETATWPVDSMTQLTAHVAFDVQGSHCDVSVSTLAEPTQGGTNVTTSTRK